MSKHIHLIGIGGSGLSAIARLLIEKGWNVSGSDQILSPIAHELAQAGARVYEGHQAENILGAELVLRSSAVPDQNPEVIAARAAGIPVVKRSDFLGSLLAEGIGIAVAGTHGKTTTTAMFALCLTRLEVDPSYLIGGISKNLHGNAHAGKGDYFVIEADEYDRMFLGLHPYMAVVTTLEHDHPDCYPTFEEYQHAFLDFTHQIQPCGILLVCSDSPAAAQLAGKSLENRRVFRYGFSQDSDYCIQDALANSQGGTSFNVCYHGELIARIALQIPGLHNAANATAVLAGLHQLGFDPQATADALAEFSGTGRRFDLVGKAWGVTVINDYAHHPTEIRATLAAARQRYPQQRIWAVWQPHTFSRTQTLLADFAAAFGDADQVLVTPIYAAREKNDSFSAQKVVDQMSEEKARYFTSLEAVRDHLLTSIQPGDILLVLSAGNADTISSAVYDTLVQREGTHA